MEAAQTKAKRTGARSPRQVDIDELTLPPKDEGWRPWVFLTGSFFAEVIIGGLADSFGLFEDYYKSHAPYNEGHSNSSIIGRSATYLGAFLMVLGLVLASFATSINLLILFQGVIYASGCAILYPPAVLFADDWFDKKKGLAYGVICSGTGFAGVVTPIILSRLLKSFNLHSVFRIWALVTAVACVPVLLVVKPRVPDSLRANPSRNPDLMFFRSKAFNLYQVANIIQGLGYFVPSVYLPLFARTVGFSSDSSNPLLVSLFNGSLVFGSIIVGMLTDHRLTNFSILATSIGAVLSVLLLWGLSVNLAILC
ncbi:hypothetical protein KEM52_005873, partial [Ascosphaera acerosa]